MGQALGEYFAAAFFAVAVVVLLFGVAVGGVVAVAFMALL